MRKFGVMFFLVVSMMALFAGDVANFVNLGFSPDGSRFVFGQYGLTDGDFRSYADIYCVDVTKNDFLKDGKFTTAPSAQTAGKEARGVFTALQNTACAYLSKQGIDSAHQGRALYVHTDEDQDMKNISFRDFETGTAYAVALQSLSEGAGADVKSSFYLNVEITAADGKVTRKTVGLPGLKRAGVQGYVVRRILCDDSGKSLVFVVEKKLYDPKGSSVRFMVETFRQ